MSSVPKIMLVNSSTEARPIIRITSRPKLDEGGNQVYDRGGHAEFEKVAQVVNQEKQVQIYLVTVDGEARWLNQREFVARFGRKNLKKALRNYKQEQSNE